MSGHDGAAPADGNRPSDFSVVQRVRFGDLDAMQRLAARAAERA